MNEFERPNLQITAHAAEVFRQTGGGTASASRDEGRNAKTPPKKLNMCLTLGMCLITRVQPRRGSAAVGALAPPSPLRPLQIRLRYQPAQKADYLCPNRLVSFANSRCDHSQKKGNYGEGG